MGIEQIQAERSAMRKGVDTTAVGISLTALARAKLSADSERGPTRKYGWTSNPKAGRLR